MKTIISHTIYEKGILGPTVGSPLALSQHPLKGSPRPIPRGSFKMPQNKQCVARPFRPDTPKQSPGKAPSGHGGPFSCNKGLAIGQSRYPI